MKQRGGSIRRRRAIGSVEETVDGVQRGRSGSRRAARVPDRFRQAGMQRFEVERHEHRARVLFCLVAQVQAFGSAPRLAALLRSFPIPGGSEVPGFERASHGSDRGWSIFCTRTQLESSGHSKQAIALCINRRLTRRRRVATERPWTILRYALANRSCRFGVSSPRAASRSWPDKLVREALAAAVAALNSPASERPSAETVSLPAVHLHRLPTWQSEAKRRQALPWPRQSWPGCRRPVPATPPIFPSSASAWSSLSSNVWTRPAQASCPNGYSV